MKLYQFITTDVNSAFLYLFILFADIDYAGIADYTLKALIGGAVWFGFKIIGDYYGRRVKNWHKTKVKTDKENNP